MTKTILVPVDISHPERFENMIQTAEKLADNDAQIVALYVVEEIPAFVSAQLSSDISKQTISEANKTLDELLSKSGTRATKKIVVGHAANSILNVAEDIDADAIVVGSHKPDWQDYLIGSTAARVVRHAKCSVYVLR